MDPPHSGAADIALDVGGAGGSKAAASGSPLERTRAPALPQKFFGFVADAFQVLDPTTFQQYVEFKPQRLYEVCSGIALILPITLTRMNLQNVGLGYSWLWALAFATFILTSLALSLHVSIMLLMFIDEEHPASSSSVAARRLLHGLQQLRDNVNLPSLVMVIGTISSGLQLLAKVDAGACPTTPALTIWGSQPCNPVASAGSIPHDSVLFLFSFPLLVMSFLRCGDYRVICLSYVLATAAVALALALAKALIQLYTAVYGAIFFVIALQLERLSRGQFMAQLHAREAARGKRRLLLNILPERVVEDLVAERPVRATAHPHVCCFFSDVVQFTELTAAMGPFGIADLLNELYTVMDSCLDDCPGVRKVS